MRGGPPRPKGSVRTRPAAIPAFKTSTVNPSRLLDRMQRVRAVLRLVLRLGAAEDLVSQVAEVAGGAATIALQVRPPAPQVIQLGSLGPRIAYRAILASSSEIDLSR